MIDQVEGPRPAFRGSSSVERCTVEILVVDDSKVMREMIVACLRGEPGLRFTHAASGLEAIERLSLGRFDTVFLDLNMPDIGGYEVLEFVRSQDVMREVPIVIVTTRGDDSSRERALAAGATRFMTKPFEPAEILAVLRSLLPERPSRG
jgi:two-component system, chemotaxis family, chemotaxis protein CheY